MTSDVPTRRGLRRSVRLFRAFLVEQTDPHRFYSELANDSVSLLDEHTDLRGRTVLDVGAGPSEFARAFRDAGARYVSVDHDASVSSVRDGGVVGDALRRAGGGQGGRGHGVTPWSATAVGFTPRRGHTGSA